MSCIEKLLLLTLLAPFSGVGRIYAAEFEVVDRFSVDGYTVLRGSADIPGGSFSVGESTFAVKDGKVGIGTASPGYKLDVAGGVNIGGANWLTFAGANTLYSSAGVGFFIQQTDAATPTLFRSYTGANHLVISTSGSVGIGTASPGAKLDINQLGGTASASALSLRAGNSSNTFGSNQILFGYNGTNLYQHAIKSRHHSSQQSTNALDFFVWNYAADAAAEVGTKNVMTLDGTGNVGIGTTEPGAKLEVGGGIKLANDPGVCNASKAGTIRFTGTSFEGCTGTAWKTFENSPPSLTGVNPNTGTTRGGYTITITGSNFASPAAVVIGGVAATNVTTVSGVTITATAPAQSSAGAKDVRVTNPDGLLSTLTGAFTAQASGESQTVAGVSCKGLFDTAGASIGDNIYWIDPNGGSNSDAFQAYCDMTTNGGGWTIVTAQSGAGQNGLADDAESAGNPLSYQAYNLNLLKKEYISAVSSESLIKRSAGVWLKASHALFDNNLTGAGDQHTHWQVTVTASNGATAVNCQMGYSNYANSGGGDYGITTAGAVFDHHGANYYHLNSSCASMHFYNYGTTYNVNTALGDWPLTNACGTSTTELGGWYAAMR